MGYPIGPVISTVPVAIEKEPAKVRDAQTRKQNSETMKMRVLSMGNSFAMILLAGPGKEKRAGWGQKVRSNSAQPSKVAAKGLKTY
jgi:hypothetical protein